MIKFLDDFSMLSADVPKKYEHLNGCTPALVMLLDQNIRYGFTDENPTDSSILVENELRDGTIKAICLDDSGTLHGCIKNTAGDLKEYPLYNGRKGEFWLEVIAACLIKAAVLNPGMEELLPVMPWVESTELVPQTEETFNSMTKILKHSIERDMVKVEDSVHAITEANIKDFRSFEGSMKVFDEEKELIELPVKSVDYGIGLTVKEWLANEELVKCFSVKDKYDPTPEEVETLKAQEETLKDYIVTPLAMKIVRAYTNSGIRKGILSGEAGTGKSTDCFVAATLLGLVYENQVCNYETTSSDLTQVYVPQTGEKLTPEFLEEFETLKTFSYGEAYKFVTGKDKEDATLLDCSTAFAKRFGSADTKLVAVDSPIVVGARRPRFVEIQEAQRVRATGIFSTLNSLFDGLGRIRTKDGEYVYANNLSLNYITTNGENYAGNSSLPADFRSRFGFAPKVEKLNAKKMCDILFTNKDITNLLEKAKISLASAKEMALKMAKTTIQLRDTIEDNYNVSLGQREYELWFRSWIDTKDVKASALETVIQALVPESTEEETAYVEMINL